MTEWEVSQDIRADRRLSEAVDQTRSLIDDVLGETTPPAAARWHTDSDPSGRLIAVLNLSDWTYPEGVEARFRPEELGPDPSTSRKVQRLCGELLQVRNHKLLEELVRTGGW